VPGNWGSLPDTTVAAWTNVWWSSVFVVQRFWPSAFHSPGSPRSWSCRRWPPPRSRPRLAHARSSRRRSTGQPVSDQQLPFSFFRIVHLKRKWHCDFFQKTYMKPDATRKSYLIKSHYIWCQLVKSYLLSDYFKQISQEEISQKQMLLEKCYSFSSDLF